MMIFFSGYISYLIPSSYVGITILLWSSCTDTCNENFGTRRVSKLPPRVTLRQSFAIWDLKPADVVE